jgi:hypothetical protein
VQIKKPEPVFKNQKDTYNYLPFSNNLNPLLIFEIVVLYFFIFLMVMLGFTRFLGKNNQNLL